MKFISSKIPLSSKNVFLAPKCLNFVSNDETNIKNTIFYFKLLISYHIVLFGIRSVFKTTIDKTVNSTPNKKSLNTLDLELILS